MPIIWRWAVLALDASVGVGRSPRLRGAHAITVPMGHSGLVVSPRVYQKLISVLRPEPRSQGETAEDEGKPDRVSNGGANGRDRPRKGAVNE